MKRRIENRSGLLGDAKKGKGNSGRLVGRGRPAKKGKAKMWTRKGGRGGREERGRGQRIWRSDLPISRETFDDCGVRQG